jgi:hypothetical protein
MLRKRACALAVSGALIAIGGAGAAVPASAAPLERGTFHDVFSEVRDECGLTVLFEEDIRGSFLVNTRGADGLVYFSATVHGTQSWTNLATGKSYSTVFDFADRDHKVTDNGDGTLTILFAPAGGQKWLGPDGKWVFREPGTIRFAILVDHGGTPDDPSDDEFLADLGLVKESTGLNETEGRDFCEDLVEFTS